MDTSQLITIGIFLAGLAISHIRGAANTDTATKVLKAHMENMQRELVRVQDVLTKLADVSGRIDTLQQVNVLQGKRVDELQSSVNRLLEGARS